MKNFQSPGRRFRTEDYFKRHEEEEPRSDTLLIIIGYAIFTVIAILGSRLIASYSGRGGYLVMPFLIGAVVVAVVVDSGDAVSPQALMKADTVIIMIITVLLIIVSIFFFFIIPS